MKCLYVIHISFNSEYIFDILSTCRDTIGFHKLIRLVYKPVNTAVLFALFKENLSEICVANLIAGKIFKRSIPAHTGKTGILTECLAYLIQLLRIGNYNLAVVALRIAIIKRKR